MTRTVLYWVGKRGTPYVTEPNNDHVRIYCIGNPAVWWACAAAPSIFAAWALASMLTPKRAAGGRNESADADGAEERVGDDRPVGGAGPLVANGGVLLLGYFLNWLPFASVERVAFLYHFLPALLHALLLAGVVLDSLVPPTPLSHRRSQIVDAGVDEQRAGSAYAEQATISAITLTNGTREPNGRRWLVCGVLVLIFASCLGFFSPIVYGVPLSKEGFRARMWLASWD